MRHTSAELRLWDNVVLQQQSVSLPHWALNTCTCVSGFRLVHCASLVDAVAPPTTTFPKRPQTAFFCLGQLGMVGPESLHLKTHGLCPGHEWSKISDSSA